MNKKPSNLQLTVVLIIIILIVLVIYFVINMSSQEKNSLPTVNVTPSPTSVITSVSPTPVPRAANSTSLTPPPEALPLIQPSTTENNTTMDERTRNALAAGNISMVMLTTADVENVFSAYPTEARSLVSWYSAEIEKMEEFFLQNGGKRIGTIDVWQLAPRGESQYLIVLRYSLQGTSTTTNEYGTSEYAQTILSSNNVSCDNNSCMTTSQTNEEEYVYED